jgi:hypothetical protein
MQKDLHFAEAIIILDHEQNSNQLDHYKARFGDEK